MFNQSISAYAASVSSGKEVNYTQANGASIQAELQESTQDNYSLFSLAQFCEENIDTMKPGDIITADQLLQYEKQEAEKGTPKFYKYLGQSGDGNAILEEIGMYVTENKLYGDRCDRYKDGDIVIDIDPEIGDVSIARFSGNNGLDGYIYDDDGNCILTQKRTYDSDTTRSYEYDKNGNIIKRTIDNGSDGTIDGEYTYGYSKGQLEEYSDGFTTLKFNKAGYVKSAENPYGEIKFEYNKNGQMTRVIESAGLFDKNEYEFLYDGNGNLKTTIFDTKGKQNDCVVSHEIHKGFFEDELGMSFTYTYLKN